MELWKPNEWVSGEVVEDGRDWNGSELLLIWNDKETKQRVWGEDEIEEEFKGHAIWVVLCAINNALELAKIG